MRSIIACLVIGLGLGACYGTSGTVAYSSGSYYGGAGAPDLIAIDAGVSVIPDYEVPIFYSSGFYWRWHGGYWYRSPYYTGGWRHVSRPPHAIARIDRPYRYTHYRPYGYVPRQRVYRQPMSPTYYHQHGDDYHRR